MKRRGVTNLLVQLLNRTNEELLILVISFLKKLSLYSENKVKYLPLSIDHYGLNMITSRHGHYVLRFIMLNMISTERIQNICERLEKNI